MSKKEFSILLFLPAFIIILSLISINTSNELNSFASEMDSRSNDATGIITNWKKVGITDNKKLKELASLNQSTLTSVQSLYKNYSEFSTNMSELINSHFFYIMFISLLNIYLVISIYRKNRNVGKNT